MPDRSTRLAPCSPVLAGLPPRARRAPVVLGIDLGDRRAEVCVLTTLDGEVAARFKVDMDAESMRETLGQYRGALTVIEAGAQSAWVSRTLTSLGLQVVVANPNQLHLISHSQRKTDRADAEILARLARADLSLLRPVHHRSEEAQAHVELLRARDAVVRARTLQINHVRSALKAFGCRAPACDATTFDWKAPPHVPKQLEPALRHLLRSIGVLTRLIRRYDKLVEALCEERYKETERLRKIKGVGPITSLAFVLVLGDKNRFAKSRRVGSYLGLTPGVSQSGDSDPQKRVTKAGNGFLRRLLVQSSHYILGRSDQDSALRRAGMELMERGGKRGKKRAVIAVARRLAVTMHRIWVTGQDWDPLRGARPLAPQTPAEG